MTPPTVTPKKDGDDEPSDAGDEDGDDTDGDSVDMEDDVEQVDTEEESEAEGLYHVIDSDPVDGDVGTR